MRLVGLLATVLVACVNSDSVVCSDGTICPNGTICATVTQPDQTLCVNGDQLDACNGKTDHVACTTSAITKGRCYGGACLAVACGNGRVDSADPALQGDTGELCDDGNNVSGDGCSADCLSDEKCGNGVVDGVAFEQCDDGNLIDHDGCTSTCTPEAPRWHPISTDTISARTTKMAYDAEHEQIVLFGGTLAAGNVLTSETWLWNGSGWVAASPPSSPSPRDDFAIAYDAKRHRVVVFGGSDQYSDQSDTWEWDGEVWTQITPPVSPPSRSGAAMAYDAARHKIVLFGGRHQDAQFQLPFADTWEYDGTTWTQITTTNAPTGRAGAMMGYDPKRGRIVLYGGGNGQASSYTDTLEYDGSDWHRTTPPSPGVRSGAGFAWDASSSQLVLFGGTNAGGTEVDETWSWNGTTWTQYTGSPKPGARTNHGMAFDGARHTLLVFGGTQDDPPSTWTFRSNSWTNLGPRPPDAQLQAQAAFDSERGRAVMVDDNGLTWESDGKSWTYVQQAPAPDRSLPAITYDVAHARTVLFGGIADAGTTLGDTWTWTGAAWTHATPAMSPSPRASALVYDAARHDVVLFGGNTDGSYTSPAAIDDTWTWDGTTWTPRSPAHKPTARSGHALAYDPIRAEVVLFGGRESSSFTDTGETWTWDGSDWTQQHPAVSPAARDGAAFVWNASRRRLTLFGGRSVDGLFGDVWEWDGVSWSPVAAGTSPRGRFDAAAFPAADGGGVVLFGGGALSGLIVPLDDTWELRWTGTLAGESCGNSDDVDGDMLGGCADPDCWYRCTPECPPGTSCTATDPKCGDGTCNAGLEDCYTCPSDCGQCTPVCGDLRCDGNESTMCPGDC